MNVDYDKQLDSFVAYITAQRNLSLNTVKAYRADVGQFFDYCRRAQTGIDQVDHKFIRRYLAFLQNFRLSRRTLARKVSSVRSFYKFLRYQWVGVSADPTQLISMTKMPKPLPKVLRVDQVDLLLSLPDSGKSFGLRDRAIMEVLYGGGIRVGELVALDVDSIDWRLGELKVFGKGAKERIVPLNERAMKTLAEYLETARTRLIKAENLDERALFINRFGKRLSDGGVRRLLKTYAKPLRETAGVTPHTFRHTFATHLLEGGAGLRAVQELLGHVDLSSTQIYTHVGKSKLRRIYDRAHPRA